MPCFSPLRAFRTRSGEVKIGKEYPDSTPLALPCGGCIGCRQGAARAWALRAHLELQIHPHAAFTTLTYDDAYLPPTLQKTHLSAFLKRFRAARPKTAPAVRFFASGEYGTEGQRPHYHAILYGVHHTEHKEIEAKWPYGYARTYEAHYGAIAYVAGYTAKKYTDKRDTDRERIDYTTGEAYHWQPPFLQMSLKPGIGSHARKWVQSWRSYAILHDRKIPVPRYLHDAYKATATPLQLEQLEYEQAAAQITLNRDISKERLTAGEIIAIAAQTQQTQKRRLK